MWPVRKLRGRRLAVAASGLVVAACLAIGLSVGDAGPGVTPANIAAVRPGMTYAEVESLMGCPSGTAPPNAAGLVRHRNLPDSFVVAPHGRRGAGHDWVGRRAAAFVSFDAAGRVEEVRPYGVSYNARKPWWQFW